MSADEDTELRDLIVQTLEANGVLGKFKAQLRSTVFIALEEYDSSQNKVPLVNTKLKKFIETKEGKLVASLVHEFLTCFDLDYTLAVYEPEAGIKPESDRQHLARDVGIDESNASPDVPLLAQVLRSSQKKPEVVVQKEEPVVIQNESPRVPEPVRVPQEIPHVHIPKEIPKVNIPKELTPEQVDDAQQKFIQYDTDENGVIDKDELWELFTDMFPGFHRNMLERYVNDEFRAVDKDHSNSIDFEEFLVMYKRLFIICCGVVVSGQRDANTLVSQYARIQQMKELHAKTDIPSEKPKERVVWHSSRETHNGPHGADDFTGSIDDDDYFDDNYQTSGIKSFNKVNTSSSTPSQNTSDKGRSSQIPVLSPGWSVGKTKDTSKTKTAQNTDTSKAACNGMNTCKSLPPLINKTKLTSLGDAPPLFSNTKGKTTDGKGSGIEYGKHDVEYEDDFSSPEVEASNENIVTEDIGEDLSEADDLLKSLNSMTDDLTTDRTLSQHDGGGFDYMEDVQTH